MKSETQQNENETPCRHLELGESCVIGRLAFYNRLRKARNQLFIYLGQL